MKQFSKLLALFLALVMCLSLAACNRSEGDDGSGGGQSSNGNSGQEGEPSEKTLMILHINNGTLGEGGVADMADAALKEFQKSHKAQVNTVELSYDTSLYESSVMDACRSKEYDLIVTGFYDMVESVTRAAEEYPDQKFLVYDTEFDYSNESLKNVKSVQALQNEGAFLAGALAALMTTVTDVDGINGDKVVGFVGAAENTAIQDYLWGFIEGVNYIDSQINVLYSFVGDWSNSALAKELAISQFQQGADISFSVCGAAGYGVAEAAEENNHYSIGVDKDMAMEISSSSPETAKHIMSSCVKDMQRVVYDALTAWVDGTLEWGTHTLAGVKEGGMKLADNEYYQAIVPQEIKDQIAKVVQDLCDGKIKVGTAIGASQEEIDAIKDLAKPH